MTEKPSNQLCDPAGIRVWRGFRSRAFLHKRAEFQDKIASIFVPQTAQQMEPLGLAAYFPALLPDSLVVTNDLFLKIPDEIALVVYPSREAYREAISSSVAGRAYGLLHWPVFNSADDGDPPIPKSKSDHPEPWTPDWEQDQSYYLVADNIDWRLGETSTLAAKPKQDIPSVEFRTRLTDLIVNWRSLTDKNIDGAILCVCEDYLLYWEHRPQPLDNKSLIPGLLELLETPYLLQTARHATVPPAFSEGDKGVEMNVGDVLDVRVASN